MQVSANQQSTTEENTSQPLTYLHSFDPSKTIEFTQLWCIEFGPTIFFSIVRVLLQPVTTDQHSVV